MDALLKLAADAGLEVSAAEEALGEGAHQAARDALDRASDVLAELRRRWPEMTSAERAVVGRAAGDVRARLDAAAARVPRRRTLSEGAPEPTAEDGSQPAGEGDGR